jgi:SNF2 family DNA or RNA helicase
MPVTLYKVRPECEKQIYKAIAPMTFRLDSKDHLELPKLTYNKITVPLTSKLRKQYKDFENDFILELESVEAEASTKAILGLKLRQFVQGGLYNEEHEWKVIHKLKVKALQELLESAAGQPILCCIQFRGELAMIQDAIGSVPVIAGGTPAQEANKYIKQWNDGSLPLLLCHPASLSHGVNLQSGGHVILWYSLTWSLEHYSQLNGRLHRQGQKRNVVVHHLVMEDTVDEHVLQALQRKDMQQSKLLNFLREKLNG